MKAPQDRSTPYQITDGTTRLVVNEVGDLVFESKYHDESRYGDFIRITSIEGASMFVDVLQYLYASVNDEQSMPARFKDRKPLDERSRRFSFSHPDIEVGYTDQKVLVEQEENTVDFYFTNSEEGRPMWIGLDEIEKVQEMCRKWSENYSQE